MGDRVEPSTPVGPGEPAPATATDLSPGVPARNHRFATWARHDRFRAGLGVAVAVAVAVLAVMHRSAVEAGGASLAAADLEWLFLALGLTTALWVAGTATQLGAVSVRPPLTQLFAVQVAGSFANHVVPGGVGGMAVNVRFLQRAGMTRPAAVASVGLSSVATMITHLLLIAATWALAPIVLPDTSPRLATGFPPRLGLSGALSVTVSWIGAAVAIALLLTLALTACPRAAARVVPRRLSNAGARLRAHVVRELVGVRKTLSNPSRALLLWGGSAAAPVLHAVILVAVFKSLSGGLPALILILTYLIASAVSALVPSPGGFGSLDLLLTAGLVSVGVASTTAIAVVVGYRLVTVWAPLVPGAWVLALLMRRRVI